MGRRLHLTDKQTVLCLLAMGGGEGVGRQGHTTHEMLVSRSEGVGAI